MSEEATNNSSVETTEPVVVSTLREKNDAWVSAYTQAFDETTIIVPSEFLVDICYFLKTAPKLGFNLLLFIYV